MSGRDFWYTVAGRPARHPADHVRRRPARAARPDGGARPRRPARQRAGDLLPDRVGDRVDLGPRAAARGRCRRSPPRRAAGSVSVVLGPGVNMKRSPLCGRNFEYLSEDPFLAGELGLAMVQGIQSHGVGTSVKHYAANNQEDDRLRVSAEVDERTLREIYLPAFERIVTAGEPWTVMCAYNKVNGIVRVGARVAAHHRAARRVGLRRRGGVRLGRGARPGCRGAGRARLGDAARPRTQPRRGRRRRPSAASSTSRCSTGACGACSQLVDKGMAVLGDRRALRRRRAPRARAPGRRRVGRAAQERRRRCCRSAARRQARSP